MAVQTPAVYRSEGDVLTITPQSAHTAGDVILVGTNLVTVAVDDFTAEDLAAGKVAHVYTRGVFDMPKDDSDLAAGDPVYWDDDGTSVDGNTGAVTDDSADGPFVGFAREAAGASAKTVEVLLRSVDDSTIPGVLAAFPTHAPLAAAGNVIGNAAAVEGTGVTLVTGADNSKGVQLPASGAGKLVILKNTVADATLKVYPPVNASIDGTGTNTAYSQPGGSLRHYYCYNAALWTSEPETIA